MKAYELAKQFNGLEEVRDNKQLQLLFLHAGFDINPAKTAWCAVFVNTMEVLAGKTGNGRLNARSFLTYGKKVDLTDAKEGDIVIFKRGTSNWEGHVTYFVSYDKTRGIIKCLGGNQGNKVCYADYPVSSLLGIVRS